MKTRYPIVLVHGLGMKDTFFMKSWGWIDRILRVQGYTVYKSNVDSFGTIDKKEIAVYAQKAHVHHFRLVADIYHWGIVLFKRGIEKNNNIAGSMGSY